MHTLTAPSAATQTLPSRTTLSLGSVGLTGCWDLGHLAHLWTRKPPQHSQLGGLKDREGPGLVGRHPGRLEEVRSSCLQPLGCDGKVHAAGQAAEHSLPGICY